MDEYAYVVNVDGVVVRDGKYLIIRRGEDEEHASDTLGFPGGKIETPPRCDDPIERTVARELSEEVGIDVGAVEYVLSTTFRADDGSRCLNIVTVCEYLGGEPHPKAPSEVADVYWLSADEIMQHDDAPSYVRAYVDAVEDWRSSGSDRSSVVDRTTTSNRSSCDERR